MKNPIRQWRINHFKKKVAKRVGIPVERWSVLIYSKMNTTERATWKRLTGKEIAPIGAPKTSTAANFVETDFRDRKDWDPATVENGRKISPEEASTGRHAVNFKFEPDMLDPNGKPLLTWDWVPTPSDWAEDPEANAAHMPKLNSKRRNMRNRMYHTRNFETWERK